MVVLLEALAHNLLVWVRGWLADTCPRLARWGLLRWIRDALHISGVVVFHSSGIVQIVLNRGDPVARELGPGLAALLAPEETAIILGEIWVVINPMRFGTGLSIKSLEALGHAKPLVTTSVGARGLGEGVGQAFLVADTPEEFASAITSVLLDVRRAEILSQNAHDFIARWNKRNLTALEDLLNA